MLKLICWVVLGLGLAACSGGAKGDKSGPRVLPTNEVALLTNFEPVGGYQSHLPLIQFIDYNTFTLRLNEVVIMDELVNTFSWATFKTSNFGSHLVGAMFINGSPKTDLYLWFTVSLANTQEIAEYQLNLTITPKANSILGFETITIGTQDPSRIAVEYTLK